MPKRITAQCGGFHGRRRRRPGCARAPGGGEFSTASRSTKSTGTPASSPASPAISSSGDPDSSARWQGRRGLWRLQTRRRHGWRCCAAPTPSARSGCKPALRTLPCAAADCKSALRARREHLDDRPLSCARSQNHPKKLLAPGRRFDSTFSNPEIRAQSNHQPSIV